MLARIWVCVDYAPVNGLLARRNSVNSSDAILAGGVEGPDGWIRIRHWKWLDPDPSFEKVGSGSVIRKGWIRIRILKRKKKSCKIKLFFQYLLTKFMISTHYSMGDFTNQ